MELHIISTKAFEESLTKLSRTSLLKKLPVFIHSRLADIPGRSVKNLILLLPYDQYNKHANVLKTKKYKDITASVIFYHSNFAPKDILPVIQQNYDYINIDPYKKGPSYLESLALILSSKYDKISLKYKSQRTKTRAPDISIKADIPLPITIIEPDSGEILFANEAFHHSMKLDNESSEPMVLFDFINNITDYRDVVKSLKVNQNRIVELNYQHSNMKALHSITSIKKISYDGEDFLLLIITDITERKKAEKHLKEFNFLLEEGIERSNLLLQRQAAKDSFTGLPNRSKFIHDIQDKSKKTLLLINVDGFSAINSAYGMDAGNAVLMQVASLLIEFEKNREHVYRTGSDEFIILKTSIKGKVENYTEKLIDFIRQHPAEYQNIDIPISISIGIVTNETDALIKKANIAMAEARKKGRGKYSVYVENPNLVQHYRDNIIWAKKVTEALKNDQIVPFFQGIRNNITAQIDKFESLVRIIDGGNIIEPRRFLESAKHTGLLSNISMVMITKCFEYMKDKPYDFSINLSNEDFTNESIYLHIRDSIKKYNIQPSRIVFEILESFSSTDNIYSLAILNKIQALGCGIAIDDFGTDYSNFARLLNIKVDYIKIDGSFIKNIAHDHNSFTIVKAITEFAHSIGCRVIAEYVTNQEIQEKVFKLGIEFSQGYLFSRPFNDSL